MLDTCSRLVVRSALVLIFVGVGGWGLSGCDGGGSKRASFYQKLVGTWTVERLRVMDGVETDYTGQLDRRYATLTFDFRAGDDGRTYAMTGPVAGDTTTVHAEGPIDLISYQSLHMLQGFPSSVVWTFEFEASDSAIFRVPQGRAAGSDAFLRTILPGMSWGESQRVELRLVRAN